MCYFSPDCHRDWMHLQGKPFLIQSWQLKQTDRSVTLRKVLACFNASTYRKLIDIYCSAWSYFLCGQRKVKEHWQSHHWRIPFRCYLDSSEDPSDLPPSLLLSSAKLDSWCLDLCFMPWAPLFNYISGLFMSLPWYSANWQSVSFDTPT